MKAKPLQTLQTIVGVLLALLITFYMSSCQPIGKQKTATNHSGQLIINQFGDTLMLLEHYAHGSGNPYWTAKRRMSSAVEEVRDYEIKEAITQ